MATTVQQSAHMDATAPEMERPTWQEKCSYRPGKFIPCSATIGSEAAEASFEINRLCEYCENIRDLVLGYDGIQSGWTAFEDFCAATDMPETYGSRDYQGCIAVYRLATSRTRCEIEYTAAAGCHLCSLLVDRFWWLRSREPNKAVEMQLFAIPDQSYALSFILHATGEDDSFYATSITIESKIPEQSKNTKRVVKTVCMTTASNGDLSWMKQQLAQCVTQHSECRSVDKVTESKQLPTRLLRISRAFDGDMQARVVKSCTLGKRQVTYASLSYCWGDSASITLTTATERQFEQQLPISALPKTCRDAIEICAFLDIEYLWIDALCIIQDLDADWMHEVRTMYTVYRYCVVCIAALDASDKSQGCFSYSNRLMYETCTLGMDQRGRIATVRSTPPKYSGYSASHPLYSRGWAVQERILSPRSIYFGASVIWECSNMTECMNVGKIDDYLKKLERGPISTGRSGSCREEITYDCPSGSIHKLSETSLRTWHYWLTVMNIYSDAILSRDGDRIAAIDGLRTSITESTGLKGFAGVWLEQNCVLPYQLLWSTLDPNDPQVVIRLAPTWSVFSMKFDTSYTYYDFNDVGHGCDMHLFCTAAELRATRTFVRDESLCQFGELRLFGALFPLEVDELTKHINTLDATSTGPGRSCCVPDIDNHLWRPVDSTRVLLDHCWHETGYCNIRVHLDEINDKIVAVNWKQSQLFYIPMLERSSDDEEESYNTICQGLIVLATDYESASNEDSGCACSQVTEVSGIKEGLNTESSGLGERHAGSFVIDTAEQCIVDKSGEGVHTQHQTTFVRLGMLQIGFMDEDTVTFRTLIEGREKQEIVLI